MNAEDLGLACSVPHNIFDIASTDLCRLHTESEKYTTSVMGSSNVSSWLGANKIIVGQANPAELVAAR
jgi:hypothetical protein